MAVSAPSDDPGYVYGSPPPPNAIDPGMWARLMGYTSGLNPISSANAAESVQRGPSPAATPTPVPLALQSGGPSTAVLGTPDYSGLPPSISTLSPNSQDGLPTSFGGGSFGQGGPPPQTMPYAGGQGPVGPAGERRESYVGAASAELGCWLGNATKGREC